MSKPAFINPLPWMPIGTYRTDPLPFKPIPPVTKKLKPPAYLLEARAKCQVKS